MANTYSQIYVHIVFAVKGRQNLISVTWKDEVYKYITGIVTNKGQKLIAINGMPDHIHILVGFKPDKTISDLVRDIKANSSKFIMTISGLMESLNGKQDLALFHTVILNYQML